MRFVVLGLLVTILSLGLPVALVVWLVSRRREGDEERAGWSLRRFLQYGFLLAALFTAASGLARLVELALPAPERLVGGRASELALGLSLSIVGVPAYGALWRLVSRRLLRDSEERASLAWSLYLATVATVSLVIAFVALVEVGSWALGVDAFSPGALASVVVWGAVWGLHTRLAHHPGWAPTGRAADLTVLAGSTVGLVGLVAGAGGLLFLGLEQLYRTVAGPALVESDAWEAARRSLVMGVVGAAVWWWHWLREAQRGSRTTLWHVYVLLLPILGGLLAAVGSAGAVLGSVLQWLAGVPDSPRAALHFEFLPGALAAGLMGAWAWWYHRTVLGEVPERRRSEPERAYEYLVAAVGLVAAASGVAVAIVALLQALAPAPLVTGDPEGRRTLVGAITLLVVGGPLWWVFWRRLQLRTGGDDVERSSPSRRVYLFLLFGAAGLTALVSLMVILFVLFRELFEAALSAGVLHDLRTPIALVVTAGLISAYHWAVYREDRAARGDLPGEPERTVLLVSSDPTLARALAERTGARVRALRRLDGEGPVDAETVSELVLASPYPRLLVVAGPEGSVQVVPYETG